MAIEVAERYADGQATFSELQAARLPFIAPLQLIGSHNAPENVMTAADAAVLLLGAEEFQVAHAAVGIVIGCREEPHRGGTDRPLCDLIREVFGNPFRPVVPDPAWLSWSDGLARRLAREIYDARRFDELPVLADALEDAGCDHRELLDHLRRPGGHVRGCWALDAVLDLR